MSHSRIGPAIETIPTEARVRGDQEAEAAEGRRGLEVDERALFDWSIITSNKTVLVAMLTGA
jgi:hypothetical protein